MDSESIEIDVNERGIVEFLALMKSIGDVDVTVNLDTAEAQQRLIAFLVGAHTLGGDINEKIDVNDAVRRSAALAAFEVVKEAVRRRQRQDRRQRGSRGRRAVRPVGR